MRQRMSHAGIPLVHPTSEHVVLANVFGIIKNLPFKGALNPWLARTMNDSSLCWDGWQFRFWEKQQRPIGVIEGNTEVDLEIESDQAILFIEVKMDAEASHSTKSDPERNQLIRNLDVGFARADRDGKHFALIYVTPDLVSRRLWPESKVTPHRFRLTPKQTSRRYGPACTGVRVRHWRSSCFAHCVYRSNWSIGSNPLFLN
jgi:hypothetical protein